MTFNFDSNEHVAYTTVPSAKAINTPAGIWVANDNQESAGWEPGKELIGGIKYDLPLRQFDELGNEKKVPGTLYKNPRLLIVGRSPLLQGIERKVTGVWTKGSGERACRRYMLILLDEKNAPLHIAPIQLTAWGNFQLEFDKKLVEFRKEMEFFYSEITKKRKEPKSELWHSVCVFCPQFKTEMKGTAPNQSPACITTGYIKPTAENFFNICVGKDDYAQDVTTLFKSSEGWWKKSLKLNEEEEESFPAKDKWNVDNLSLPPAPQLDDDEFPPY